MTVPQKISQALAAFAALAASSAVWWRTQSWWKAALVAIAGFSLGLAKKVWEKQEPKWVGRIDDWLDRKVAWAFAGYAKRYAQHLYYKHRTFDVKGFSTQGKFALELEHVYVDLDVDPAVLRSVSHDPIRLPEYFEKKDRADIFKWLGAEWDLALI